jgi:hypothetical protein
MRKKSKPAPTTATPNVRHWNLSCSYNCMSIENCPKAVVGTS